MKDRPIGPTIRQMRIGLKLSQRALAEGAGISRQQLNAIEMGHATPQLPTLVRVARMLGCHPSELWGVE